MPMIDVYSTAGTFSDKSRLAQELASAVMRWDLIAGHANTQADIAATARAALSAGG